jgi:hypothetical protein
MHSHRAERPHTRNVPPVVLALLLCVTAGCGPGKPDTPTASTRPGRFLVTKVLGDDTLARPDRKQSLLDAAVNADGTVVAVGFDGHHANIKVEPPGDTQRTVQVEKVDAMAWHATGNAHAWQRADVDLDPAIGELTDALATVQTVFGVAATPAGWIAVGSEQPDPRAWNIGLAAVWASNDGKAWQRADDPSLKPRGLMVEVMRSVVTLGDLLLATGVTDEHGDVDAAVWTSRDGQRWTRVDDPALTRPDDQLPNDVIAAGPGLVMVGNVGTTSPLDPTDRRRGQPAVWTSTDGQRWQLQTLPVPAATRTMSHQLVAVTQGGPGLVAVGVAQEGDRRLPIVWISHDGRTWQPGGIPTVQGTTPLSLTSVVSVGTSLVAFGQSGPTSTGDLVAWTSTDARTWQPLTIPASVGGGDGRQDVARARTLPDGRIIAVGAEGTGKASHPAAWLLEPSP